MNHQIALKSIVEQAVISNGFAVLSTQGVGKPHASFVAVSAFQDIAHLVFATYRDTRKYLNLLDNNQVAILFENRSVIPSGSEDLVVTTAYGCAVELEMALWETVVKSHLLRHPNLESFLTSPQCALFLVTVDAFQVVRGIDDVVWWNISTPDPSA